MGADGLGAGRGRHFIAPVVLDDERNRPRASPLLFSEFPLSGNTNSDPWAHQTDESATIELDGFFVTRRTPAVERTYLAPCRQLIAPWAHFIALAPLERRRVLDVPWERAVRASKKRMLGCSHGHRRRARAASPNVG
jgi:hypothetical protein